MIILRRFENRALRRITITYSKIVHKCLGTTTKLDGGRAKFDPPPPSTPQPIVT